MDTRLGYISTTATHSSVHGKLQEELSYVQSKHRHTIIIVY